MPGQRDATMLIARCVPGASSALVANRDARAGLTLFHAAG
jgi:hypothetical protein